MLNLVLVDNSGEENLFLQNYFFSFKLLFRSYCSLGIYVEIDSALLFLYTIL